MRLLIVLPLLFHLILTSHKCLAATSGVPSSGPIGNDPTMAATQPLFERLDPVDTRDPVLPDGVFLHNVPIALPPGLGNLKPDISLQYDSMRQNGVLGVGWRLTGLSTIHRCSLRLVPDGVISSLSYSQKDRLCLDGTRLVLRNGTYWSEGATYRTQIETWQNVVSVGSDGTWPQKLVVYEKNGLVREYGGTPDSRVEAQGTSVIRSWALNKIEDRNGNFITFSYSKDNAIGEHHLKSIAYTGNTALNRAPGHAITLAYS